MPEARLRQRAPRGPCLRPPQTEQMRPIGRVFDRTSTGRADTSHAAFAVMAAAGGLYCALAASRMYPLVDGDGLYHFPVAVEWSLGRPLTNPLLLSVLHDPLSGPDGSRYTYHGFLYALLVGGAARALGGGPTATVGAAYCMHWVASLAAALAVFVWADLRGLKRVACAVILPPSMLALSVAWHGRMESLVIGLVGAAVLAWRWPGVWRSAVGGLVVSLVFFTSPACGVVGALVFVAATMWSRQDAQLWTGLWAATVMALIGAGLCLLVYPFSLTAWVDGVLRHSRSVLAQPMGRGFVATWLVRPELPLLAVSVAALAAGTYERLGRVIRPLQGGRRTAVISVTLLIAAALIRLAFVKTEASYNAVVWMPVSAAVALSHRPPRWCVWAVTVALVLPALGLARSSVILARQFSPHVVGFDEARTRLHELTPMGCVASSGLWMAADMAGGATTSGTRPECIVRQQTYTGASRPPELPGYQLVENRFAPATRLLGIPIARTAGGWQFAVYARIR